MNMNAGMLQVLTHCKVSEPAAQYLVMIGLPFLSSHNIHLQLPVDFL